MSTVYKRTPIDQFVEFGDWTFNVLGRVDPHRATGGLVTSNFFPLLGARPHLGRMLVATDGARSAAPVVVLMIPLSRFLSGLLFGVEPADPVTIVTAAALLLGVALVAAWIPARAATAVDPMTALRQN